MRRIVIIAAILCAVAAAARPENPAVLRYSTNPFYPPYDWAAGADGFDGASVELLSLVLPPDVSAIPVREPWKRVLSMAASGDIDLLLSLRITPERSEYLRFTTHRAFPNPIAVFVLSGSSISVSDWSCLKPYTGGVSLGDTFGGGFDEYMTKELSVESAPSMVENFRKLLLGRIDYFVSGYYMGMSYLAAVGLSEKIVALKPFVSDQDIHFAFSKKSPWVRLLPSLDATLARLDSKGRLEAILRKHLARFSGGDAQDVYR